MKLSRPLQLIRLLHINVIILRNRLDAIVLSTHFLQPFRFLKFLNPWSWFKGELKPRGVSIRVTLEELGPVFVKFGQILSIRRDILPDDIITELEKLQDAVPPFSSDVAKAMIEQQFAKSIDEIFLSFDLVPLASASIAQVHAAVLHNGKKVIVKILRPGITKIIQRDITLLYFVALLSEILLPYGKKLRAREIVAEFEKSIAYELDLIHEGANASQLRRNFLNSNLLYVPEIFWEHSSRTILVMERVEGVPISDKQAIIQNGVNLKKLAENGVEIFFTQVFRDSFFHADMHPGNIFVSTKEPHLAKYIAVDFGIMGTLSPSDQRFLAENLLAFFNRDYRRIAELHFKSTQLGKKVRVEEFETAIRGVCEPIFERPFKDISFGKLLLKVLQAARDYNMEIQPQFFLLQKTLLNIEGLGRQLYPELNLWVTAKPYIEKWVRKQLGPIGILNQLYQNLPELVEKMTQIPYLLHEQLTLQLAQQQTAFSPQADHKKKLKQVKWISFSLGLFAMASISITMLLTNHASSMIMLTVGTLVLVLFFLALY